MPYVLVEDFKAGIDTRRTSVTSVPGSLYGLNADGVAGLTNAHITRGGEIEKRRAFKLWATLPTGETYGLAAGGGNVYVFADCHTGRPSMTGQPESLSVLKCESRYKGNTGEEDMAKVLSVDFFDAKPYAAIEFEDGLINHYWGDHDDPGASQEATEITSLDATANTLTKASHGLANGAVVRLTTSDTLPTGFALATDYYVVSTATDTFKLEASVGSGAISFSGGTGTHSYQSGVAMNRIIQQYDGRARVGFSVTGGALTSSTGTAASGTVIVNAGSEFAGNNILFLRVDNVDIITGTVAHTGSNTVTAAAIATAINAKTSVPNYTATASGTTTVTITAADKGTVPNGKAITSSTEGDFGLVNGTSPLVNGEDNAITNITMDGISIIRDPILWETSHPYTATKIADEINSTATLPEWEAVASGSVVTIIAETQGAATNSYYNGVVHVETKTGDLATTNPTQTVTSGGASIASGQQAGSFIYSNKYAIHSLEESTWRWCGVGDPTQWTGASGASINSAPGAGFQVLSNHARNSEELMAMATYYENMAILAQDCIQIWFSDPDPAVIQLVQVLNNTGTIASKSVVAIGDSDVFYLARSGIRSLKSRDSSNAAYIGDIGNSIDSIIISAVQADDGDGRGACGILDPRSGRYYLAIGLKVYVFSYFPSSKVSAWSVYEPGFIIEEWAFDGRQVLCRSGDKIYSLGGINDNEYDSCKVTVQLPFLDASTPATDKMWSGIDLVSSSTWTIKVGGDPTDIEANELAATINKVTYGLGRVGLSTTSTHISLKLENEQSGAAKLGTLTVHYSLNEAG